MNYTNEKQRIIDYITENGVIIELLPDKSNEKMHYQEIERLENNKKIAIRYPGYKTTSTKCDYCVVLVTDGAEEPISHIEIMNDLYKKTTQENYLCMKGYLEDVARYGLDVQIPNVLLDIENDGFSFQELTYLMFYIAIQEDINYPAAYYQGRKMCFYRYLEAIYCKVYTNHVLGEAIARAKAKNYIPPKWTDVGNLYNIVAEIRR